MALSDYLFAGAGFLFLFWPVLYGLFTVRKNVIWFSLFCGLVFLLSYVLIEIMLFPVVVWMIKFSHYFEGYELFYSIVKGGGFIAQTIIDSFWGLYIAIPVIVRLRVGEFAQPGRLGLSGFKDLIARLIRHLTRRSSRGRQTAPLS